MRMFILAAIAATQVSPATLAGQTPGTLASAEAVRDPNSLAALERMGAALRKLTSFSVRADTTEERVLTTGQKIQYVGVTETKVQNPTRIRVDRYSDRHASSLYFDGTTLTIYSPRIGFYGLAQVNGTIRQAVEAVAQQYDIETPLADLFAFGDDASTLARLTSAFYVGAETIGGHACDQYALRQPDVDWQIWIRQTGEPLPCKLVITSTDDPSFPQSSAVYNWDIKITHAASDFTFTPPPGSRRIPLERKAPIEPSPTDRAMAE